MSAVAVCAGAGGLALGMERAGFEPLLLIEKRQVICETLRLNRPAWNVLEGDLLDFDPDAHPYSYDVDLLYGGLPRVKASAAVSRRDSDEEIRILEATVMLAHAVRPRALLIENVPDLAVKPEYEPIREFMATELSHLGYEHIWFTLNAMDYGVPQNRKQSVLIAFSEDSMSRFVLPEPETKPPSTVGGTLHSSMGERGWTAASEWAALADTVAPTLVGGSWNRGGADLGPTGSKRAWARLGVDGGTVADQVPGPEFQWDPGQGREGMVRLTIAQTALLQGFPSDWVFAGRKTARYRQVGHATPPPVGCALGNAVRKALERP
ncbi:DNA cytosine methyltransferase [Glycomyces tritici]|uniref:DNA (cytosine-5-)-methyltransferase n=1 Tax=Glycomyces tritici TaxID=2665176 RepID=A0ABT7YJ62_9ACTN|nr:DNA cytosine methyltransferase [Glycomyces tritici]MDN3238677.1 DNA cytosine methyltransferase [Glycomyces tritici]